MGGIVILAGFIVTCLVFAAKDAAAAEAAACAALFGLLGFVDDYIKITKKRSLGLTAKQKMLAQIGISCVFAFLEIKSGAEYFSQSRTSVLVPFLKSGADLKYLYAPFVVFTIVGCVNCANFTDGQDGLNAGVTLIACVFLLCAAVLAKSAAIAPICAMIGTLTAFLLFNCYPARVFMGDTGSMALGAFTAIIAIMLKVPLFLFFFAFIYIAEGASVIMQVLYFKATKGKRILKMAPVHHHFELSGFHEARGTVIFCVAAFIAGLVGVLGLI